MGNEVVFPSPTLAFTGIGCCCLISLIILFDYYFYIVKNQFAMTKTRAFYYFMAISFIGVETATNGLFYGTPNVSCLIFLGQRSGECMMPLIVLFSFFIWTYDFFLFRTYGTNASGLINHTWQSIISCVAGVFLIVQIAFVSAVIQYNTPYDCTPENPHLSPLYYTTYTVTIIEMILFVIFIVVYFVFFILRHKNFKVSFKTAEGKQYIIFFVRFAVATIILLVSLLLKIVAFLVTNEYASIEKQIFTNQVPLVIQFVAQTILTFNTAGFVEQTPNYDNLNSSF
ncbi:hypothetical protein EIN_044060 [Entamoeba invadens IP1]|uniref:Uncharacterized protein n=1 Tax=Entamoeba invadens IP1 TaxID=370355 RepID=A0A0A1U2J5_ENTIV|nr:hypothetical protein EIN_044060 [Entamoeba invadens IP1]ELP86858.1 hypothetical protein EIN_044060 [Entamoeba invadens IP1]|eukprot:XP_004253629.1 hypothetical protein EIN_044060 [Entamoeba invadens IP1]